MNPFIKKAPGWQTGGNAKKSAEYKSTTHNPKIPAPLGCFGKAHEPYGRGDCASCPPSGKCAIHSGLRRRVENQRRRRDAELLAWGVHKKTGQPLRILRAEYEAMFDYD